MSHRHAVPVAFDGGIDLSRIIDEWRAVRCTFTVLGSCHAGASARCNRRFGGGAARKFNSALTDARYQDTTPRSLRRFKSGWPVGQAVLSRTNDRMGYEGEALEC